MANAEPQATPPEETPPGSTAREPVPPQPTAPAEPPAPAEPSAPEPTPREPTHGASGASERPRRRGVGRFWVWLALMLVAAAVVGSFVGVSLATRQGGPLSTNGAANGRPTIVVPTAVAPVASVSSSPAPSAVVPTAVTAVAPAAATEYVVQPGDTLRSIAQQQYGDAELWPRIYQANRDVIGADPDALKAGTRLQLPPRD